jgi:hypothetical protein
VPHRSSAFPEHTTDAGVGHFFVNQSIRVSLSPHAEHIQKQLERGYAVKDAASLTFAPTPLGESLISGYRRMGLDNLWKPDLRGRIEQGISRIAAGQVGP